MAIVSGGGGVGLPSQWTVDSHGALLIAPNAAGTPLRVQPSGAPFATFSVNSVAGVGIEAASGDLTVQISSGPAAPKTGNIIEIWNVDYTNLVTWLDGHGALVIAPDGVTAWGISDGGQERIAVSTTPADGSVPTSERWQWYDDTATAPKLRFKQKDSGGTVFAGIAEAASPLTSGALPTVALVSGTGTQIIVARAAETHTPVTFNPGVATTATCTVALSPDNVTYSTLAVVTKPVGTVFDGEIDDIAVRVPAGWYLKLTVVNATLGTTTYY